MKLNRNITITGSQPDSKTPQVQQLVKIITAMKKHKFTEQELRDQLNASKELVTRQDKFLIFQYYRRELSPWLVVEGSKSRTVVVKTSEQCQEEYNMLFAKPVAVVKK